MAPSCLDHGGRLEPASNHGNGSERGLDSVQQSRAHQVGLGAIDVRSANALELGGGRVSPEARDEGTAGSFHPPVRREHGSVGCRVSREPDEQGSGGSRDSREPNEQRTVGCRVPRQLDEQRTVGSRASREPNEQRAVDSRVSSEPSQQGCRPPTCYRRRPVDIRYITVDLELDSSASLELVVAELEPAVALHLHEHHEGLHRVALGVVIEGSPEATVAHVCELLEGLSPPARRALEQCSRRVVDLAFESGTAPDHATHVLPAALVRRAADLGLAIAVTLYRVGFYSGD